MYSTAPKHACRTLRVEDVQTILGLGRSQAYAMVRNAEVVGQPFSVVRIGNRLLVSKKSFDEFLEANGI